jgi:hypothetical protein
LIGYTNSEGSKVKIYPKSSASCNHDDKNGDVGCFVTTTTTAYKEEYNHKKQLNEYMQNTINDSFGEAEKETDAALAEIDKRINQLGGDCDSSGNAVGMWGDAVVQGAIGMAMVEGIPAAQKMLKESEAYKAFKEETEVITNMVKDEVKVYTDAAKQFVDEQATEAKAFVKSIFEEETAELEAAVDEFVDEYIPMDEIEDVMDEYLPDLGLFDENSDGMGLSDAVGYMNTAMDLYKAATFDGALKQAAFGMASKMDPTGLWPGFMSEMSAQSWRGKDIPKAMQIKGMIGTVGHLPCALGSIGTDIGLGSMGDGSLLAATEDWIGCVGSWGPLEPQNGFVYHRDAKIAAALAGYRAYKLAVSIMTIQDHPTAAAKAPMKINMDFPHKTKCFTAGTAEDLRWESKHGFDLKKAIADAKTGAYDYLLSPFKPLMDAAKVGTGSTNTTSYTAEEQATMDQLEADGLEAPMDQFDSAGNRTEASKVRETEQEGHVFTYWRKTNCCLYLLKYDGSWGPCWEVERKY